MNPQNTRVSLKEGKRREEGFILSVPAGLGNGY